MLSASIASVCSTFPRLHSKVVTAAFISHLKRSECHEPLSYFGAANVSRLPFSDWSVHLARFPSLPVFIIHCPGHAVVISTTSHKRRAPLKTLSSCWLLTSADTLNTWPQVSLTAVTKTSVSHRATSRH